MTLDEAIKHCEEKAKEIRKANEEMPTECKLSEDLCECAREHEQLAEWLKDYKRLLEEERKAVCIDNCDQCEHGVPIDGQYYEDGLPIHECGLPRDLTDLELESFMAHGHPIVSCEQKCDKCPSWIVNICENYDYYEKKYKKGDTAE